MDIAILGINLVDTRQMVAEIQRLKSLLLTQQRHDGTPGPLEALSKTFPVKWKMEVL